MYFSDAKMNRREFLKTTALAAAGAAIAPEKLISAEEKKAEITNISEAIELLMKQDKFSFFSSIKQFPKPFPIEWLSLFGCLYLSIHYAWLLDDAFVYFRYIDNFLFLDHGLVFNQGEFVEGFSSPFWLILVTIFRLTRLNYWLIVRLITVITVFFFWLVLVIVNRRLSDEAKFGFNFPLIFLSFNYGVNTYFTSGLETPLVQLMGVVYALYILRPSSVTLQVLLAISPLVRHELVLPLGLCVLWSWLYHKDFPIKMVIMSIAMTLSWEVFRIYYYADLFPNTFYLKDISDFQQGLIYLHETASVYYFYFFIVLFSLLAFLLYKKNREDYGFLKIPQRIMMIIVAAPVILYVIKISGDPRHYRYLAFPFCLMTCAFGGIFEHALKEWSPIRNKHFPLALGVLLALFIASLYPPQLESHPYFYGGKHKIVNKIEDASLCRVNQKQKTPVLPPWGVGAIIEQRHFYQQFREQNPLREYQDVTYTGACVIAYRDFYKRVIQSYGLTEAILARTVMRSDRPAHKHGLVPLAKQLAALQKSFGNKPYIGMYRKAVERGTAPPWIAKNLKDIEIIEQKIYNDHNFWNNLKLAFSFPKIVP